MGAFDSEPEHDTTSDLSEVPLSDPRLTRLRQEAEAHIRALRYRLHEPRPGSEIADVLAELSRSLEQIRLETNPTESGDGPEGDLL